MQVEVHQLTYRADHMQPSLPIFLRGRNLNVLIAYLALYFAGFSYMQVKLTCNEHSWTTTPCFIRNVSVFIRVKGCRTSSRNDESRKTPLMLTCRPQGRHAKHFPLLHPLVYVFSVTKQVHRSSVKLMPLTRSFEKGILR